MKKAILTVMVFLVIAGPSYAFNNLQAMRFLMVSALMRYGQTLYDRGDYDEASAVFTHVLDYDSHQPKALNYLKEMHPEDYALTDSSNLPDTSILEKTIAAKKMTIQKLEIKIKQMQANIAAESAE